MIRIIENEVAAGLRKTEATSDLQHMKKSRYSQHSQMEDGELPLKYLQLLMTTFKSIATVMFRGTPGGL